LPPHRRWKRSLALFTALFACALVCGCRREAAPGPDVWATVNGKRILSSEVEKAFRSRVNPDAPEPSHEEALSLKLNILDQMINTETLLQRANKMNLLASDAEVEEKFTASKSAYTEDEFQKKLSEDGLTVDDVKNDIRKQLSIQKLLNKEVAAKISVSEQDITNYYNQNHSQFNVTEPQFHVAEIVITPRPDPNIHNRKNDKAKNEAEAGRKAAMLDQKLRAGNAAQDFSQLAMDYSEDATASSGGDLGFIPESGLNKANPALKKAVLAMRPGDVSHPIPVNGGYTILKLIAKEPAGQRQLSDPQVQQSIRDLLHSRREQLLQSAYLAEMRDEAHVTNFLARQILESAGELPASH